MSSLPLKFIGVISRRKPLYMIINLFSLEVRNVKNSPGHGMWNLRRLCSAGTIYVHIKQIPVGKPLIQFIPANSFLFLFHYQVYRKTFHSWYVRTVYRKVSERRLVKSTVSVLAYIVFNHFTTSKTEMPLVRQGLQGVKGR